MLLLLAPKLLEEAFPVDEPPNNESALSTLLLRSPPKRSENESRIKASLDFLAAGATVDLRIVEGPPKRSYGSSLPPKMSLSSSSLRSSSSFSKEALAFVLDPLDGTVALWTLDVPWFCRTSDAEDWLPLSSPQSSLSSSREADLAGFVVLVPVRCASCAAKASLMLAGACAACRPTFSSSSSSSAQVVCFLTGCAAGRFCASCDANKSWATLIPPRRSSSSSSLTALTLVFRTLRDVTSRVTSAQSPSSSESSSS